MSSSNYNNAQLKNKNEVLESSFSYECTYSDNLPEILKQLNISLAFTSYQASRLMLVRTDGQTIDVNFKHFSRPMGLATSDNGLTLGTFNQIINFHREDGLLPKIKQTLLPIEQDITAPKVDAAHQYEKEFNVYENVLNTTTDLDLLTPEQRVFAEQLIDDRIKREKYLESQMSAMSSYTDACYITRSSHYSGMINLHDIAWGDDGLWVVNSSFSCLCTLDSNYSFVPRWKPHFISELVPEDRCHLNGMALRDGKPAYVTTFSKFDSAGAWRDREGYSGTLMDVASNEVLIDGLVMPHSPRWHNGKVYFCNSGLGQVCSYDPITGEQLTLMEVSGFTRGISFYGNIMFVGTSRVRSSDVRRSTPLAESDIETFAGITLINLENNTIIAQLTFTGDVAQIYDVAVLTNCHFPELIEPTHPRMRNHFTHPILQPLD